MMAFLFIAYGMIVCTCIAGGVYLVMQGHPWLGVLLWFIGGAWSFHYSGKNKEE